MTAAEGVDDPATGDDLAEQRRKPADDRSIGLPRGREQLVGAVAIGLGERRHAGMLVSDAWPARTERTPVGTRQLSGDRPRWQVVELFRWRDRLVRLPWGRMSNSRKPRLMI